MMTKFKICFISVTALIGVVVFPAQAQEVPVVYQQPVDRQLQQAPTGGTTTFSVPPNLVGTQAESNYTLGENDVIEIEVIRHPEVSGQYVVNQEGNIQYEFVGDVNVSNLTKSEVQTKLEEKLGEYIISPEITIKIIGYNSKVVYVIGEVARPGKIFMKGDEITIREALIQAGLPLLSARMSKAELITPIEGSEADTQRVDVEALLVKGDLRENLIMKPGDTLYLPPTGMTRVMRTIQPITAPITNAAGAGRAIYTGGF